MVKIIRITYTAASSIGTVKEYISHRVPFHRGAKKSGSQPIRMIALTNGNRRSGFMRPISPSSQNSNERVQWYGFSTRADGAELTKSQCFTESARVENPCHSRSVFSSGVRWGRRWEVGHDLLWRGGRAVR